MFMGGIFISYVQVMIKKDYKLPLIILGIVMTLVSAFRYGSGTDYFGYKVLFGSSPEGVISSINYSEGTELGYRLLMGITKALNLEYEQFIIIVSIIIMVIYIYEIYINSKLKIMSVTMLLSVYYPIYVNSALRQGIALAIGFMAIYKYFQYGKYKKYICCILTATLFHKTVIILLALPLIKILYNKFFYNVKINIMFILVAICLFIFRGDLIFSKVLGAFEVEMFYKAAGASVPAVGLKIINILTAYLIYKFIDKDKLSEFDRIQIYIYFIGTLLYISVANQGIYSRLLEYFTIIEIILIPNMIMKLNNKSLKIMSFSVVAMLMFIILSKDIISFTYQAQYYNKSIQGYKYITIFNKEDSYEYRAPSPHTGE